MGRPGKRICADAKLFCMCCHARCHHGHCSTLLHLLFVYPSCGHAAAAAARRPCSSSIRTRPVFIIAGKALINHATSHAPEAPQAPASPRVGQKAPKDSVAQIMEGHCPHMSVAVSVGRSSITRYPKIAAFQCMRQQTRKSRCQQRNIYCYSHGYYDKELRLLFTCLKCSLKVFVVMRELI